MTSRAQARLTLSLSALLFGLVLAGCTNGVRGVPATGSLANFSQVNPALLRGAQPDAAGIAQLQRLGVRTIINLRMPDDTWAGEAAAARARGFAYINVPLAGLGAPSEDQVARVLSLIATSPPPVFVHCEHGADRTGTIIACYRMRHDGWTAEQAFVEAKRHGFSIFQFGMRHFILSQRPVQK